MTAADQDRIAWSTVSVAGRIAHYGVGGEGRPVLFLHGWGLTGRTYTAALERLIADGLRVYAPSLPGFGGTASLPAGDVNLPGYAGWVGDFARAVGIEEPVVLVGHSFGGGVSVRAAHDHPDLVSRLVLVNSIGGSAWRDGRGVLRPMRERPLWDWGMQLRGEIQPGWQLGAMVPRIVREAVPNLVRNPGAVWRVANLARGADLAAELAELRARGVRVTVAWSERDTVIPHSAFLSLVDGLGSPDRVVVAGGHGWLIDQPEVFADMLGVVLAEAAEIEPAPEIAA